MKIYILPVSGGGFAVQIGLLKAINQATQSESDKLGYRPDIVFASSGGNVSSYIALIGNWRYNEILRNCGILNSDLFVESWTPSFFPSGLVFPLTGSVYRNGSGIKELYNKVFTKESIGKTEIWTGTYNEESQKACFFTNKSFAEALIRDDGDNSHLYDAETYKYVDRDIEKLSKICHASASIPILTEGVMIDGEKHIDGGVGYASPFFPMSQKLTEVIRKKGNSEPLQFFHFSSYNMDMRFSDSFYSRSIGLLTHQALLYDRGFIVTYLSQFGKITPKAEIHYNVNYERLGQIIKRLEKKSYVLSLSPITSPSINLTQFKGREVLDVIKKIENDFTVMVWTLLYRY